MKMKLKLADLSVKSFVTEGVDAAKIQGGAGNYQLSRRPLYCSITSDIDVCPRTSAITCP